MLNRRPISKIYSICKGDKSKSDLCGIGEKVFDLLNSENIISLCP